MTPVTAPPTRGEYLQQAIDLLWPHARSRLVTEPLHRRLAGGDYLLLPGTAEPRLLVPAGRRAATAALQRYSALRSLRSRLQVVAMRSGAGRLAIPGRLYLEPAGESFESFAADILGAPVRLSLHIGPPRANRKPVVQLLSPNGDTLAFAKIGIDALTDRLVDAEARALSRLSGAGLTAVEAPAALHHGRWQDRSLLMQSPLPTWTATPGGTAQRLTTAMREIAAMDGVDTVSLAGSEYLNDLRGRVADISEPAVREVFAHTLNALAGPAPIRLGCWHGDLTPWNVADSGNRLLVWDWERFCGGVPVGFDALHFDLQQRLHSAGPSESVARAFLRAAPSILRPWELAGEPELPALLYLVHIGARYALDGQRESGSAVGELDQWLIPALRSAVAGTRF